MVKSVFWISCQKVCTSVVPSSSATTIWLKTLNVLSVSNRTRVIHSPERAALAPNTLYNLPYKCL